MDDIAIGVENLPKLYHSTESTVSVTKPFRADHIGHIWQRWVSAFKKYGMLKVCRLVCLGQVV
jgi:hypothetical protein